MAERGVPLPSDEGDEEPLVKTGTLDGLADSYQENAQAADAYRRCMMRRGYKAWG
jgi:hypothetical protein